ncbi:MAG: roadblock/LC7 domain-containing protein [Candidatus Thorarchaeota archaeon]|nr:roadblock/LC7 domain-containing protein [Candidatus Thorarchaeota archaeon]
MDRPDYRELPKILETMNKEGGYTASVLARGNGLLVTSATSPTTNQDVVAAMCGMIADVAERVRKELYLGTIRDISLRCADGKAVFKRVGSRGDDVLIIGAIMQRDVRYHARSIGKATTRIRRLMGYK